MCYSSGVHAKGFTGSGASRVDWPHPEFRLANEADLSETYNVYLIANRDLNIRIGRNTDLEKDTLPTRALAVRRNVLRYDQERFWIADFDGKIGGFGFATLRRTLWYLASLHILPEFQGRGLGKELVRRCMGQIDVAKGSTLLTTSDSANPVSNGLYFRFGLAPQSAILLLHGQPRPLSQKGVELRRGNQVVLQECFDRLDLTVLGETRPEDHQCWATVPSMVPYLVYEKDRMVGYIYIDREGALGPAAVERPELLPATISAAFETYAADQSTPVQIRVPSDARDALNALFSEGFSHSSEVRLLLTSRKFGRFDQYLFSGADALF